MFGSYLLAIVCGYLLGSVPFGLVITRLAGLGDIRKIGSGNIGATNVLRTGHKFLALLTLLCDSGKAAFAVILFRLICDNPNLEMMAGFFAVIGHNYPVWLKFKGGKGVASTLGMMLALTPLSGLLTCLTWLLVAIIFRYSSLAALTALCLSPVYACLLSGPVMGGCYVVLALLSLWRHRGNVQRLLLGQESKIKLKKGK